MSAFDANVQKLNEGARASRRTAEELRTALAQLSREESSVVGGTWTGPAARTFVDGYDEWKQGATQTIEGLLAQANALQEAASRYRTTDTQAATRESQAGRDLDSPRMRLNI